MRLCDTCYCGYYVKKKTNKKQISGCTCLASQTWLVIRAQSEEFHLGSFLRPFLPLEKFVSIEKLQSHLVPLTSQLSCFKGFPFLLLFLNQRAQNQNGSSLSLSSCGVSTLRREGGLYFSNWFIPSSEESAMHGTCLVPSK